MKCTLACISSSVRQGAFFKNIYWFRYILEEIILEARLESFWKVPHHGLPVFHFLLQKKKKLNSKMWLKQRNYFLFFKKVFLKSALPLNPSVLQF